MSYLEKMFGLGGQTVVVTGVRETGLGGAFTRGVAQAGASKIVITRTIQNEADRTAEILQEEFRNERLAVVVSGVAYNSEEESSCETLEARLRAEGVECVHTLINCVGGNVDEATLSPKPKDKRLCFQDLSRGALAKTISRNVLANIFAAQAMTPLLFAAKEASIIEIGSEAALGGGLTRVGAYGAAKAALHAHIQWLAVEFAKHGERYGEGDVRVNGIVPGFFVADQNRKLLYKNPEKGELSERGMLIHEATPMARFGEHDELVGAALYLASPRASGFTTGSLLVVDGGFAVYQGV